MTTADLRRAPVRDFEYDVLDLLESHGAREGALLETYRQVAEESAAGDAVGYLVRLIVEDEERHHRVFTEMANKIKSLVWEVDVEPKVPAMAPRSDPRLLAETRRLLAFEIEDAKQLRKLRKALRGSPKSWLHPLLVDLMLHDTAKHIAILKHIRRQLTRG
jgi:hypothetical protein